MSQHPSLKGKGTIQAKRSVLKRFERVELLKKRGQFKDGQRVIGLPKTKPEEQRSLRFASEGESEGEREFIVRRARSFPFTFTFPFTPAQPVQPIMRLNRFLAAAGSGSRRACEALILAGKVCINGHFIRDLATSVQPDDDVRVSGKQARAALPVYILLNKPRGYVCTRSDEEGRKTIFDLIPEHYGRLFHVGRLDKESEGLILLTNDGDLSQRLTHPGHEIEKEYEVLLDKPFDMAAHSAKMLRGFAIEGGRARMERLHAIGPQHIKVVLRQGLKRQIRHMFYQLGYEVKRLMRTRIGGVEYGGIKAGQWRPLKAKEIAQLSGKSGKSAGPRAKSRPQ